MDKDKEEQKKRLTKKINAAYRNEAICMDTIKEILEIIRELYVIDVIFVDMNKSYKYYLKNELIIVDEKDRIKDYDMVVTRKQYKEMVKEYCQSETVDKPWTFFKENPGGSVLHSGIMREGECFGLIGFWKHESRPWREEERQILIEVRQLVLYYMSIDRMVRGITQYKLAKKKMSDPHILSGFYLNVETGKYHVMKLVDFMQNTVREWGDYAELLSLYAKQYVNGEYGSLFLEDFSLKKIQKKLNKENPVLYMDYPRPLKDSMDWIRYRIKLTESKEDGTPCSAIVTFKDITQEVQRRAYLSQSENKEKQTYIVIASVDLKTERYEVYVDNRDQVAMAVEYKGNEGHGQYAKLLEYMVNNNIATEYAERFEKRFSLDTLKLHFDSSPLMIQYDFPFIIKEGVFWVRLEAVRSERYGEKEKKILLYFSDITRQKKREIQLEKRKEILEKENKKKAYQLEHDPLTGVYNRQGYERILKEYKEEQKQMVYIQIDIDYFKKVNDSYGHVFGDAVLKQVAAQLTETFRAGDYVFRFGGDEFAVILNHCNLDAWSSIASKLHMLHVRLNQYLHKEMYITLSMGISCSSSGFHQDMITLADEALYHTKNNGRAGLSVIDDKHGIIFEWNDEMGGPKEVNPFVQSATGAYRIEFPQGDIKRGRLFCDEITRGLMGLSRYMSPEECYKTWADRIDPMDFEMVKKTREEMILKEHAECTYAYLHPTLGRIIVRSGGKSVKNDEEIVFYGYHQSLQETEIVFPDKKPENVPSEKEKSVEKAEEINKKKDALLAQISHEIRTPLNVVMGLSSLAMDDLDNKKKVRDSLAEIENSSRILLGIVDNILDIASFANGNLKINAHKFDLKEQITGLGVFFYKNAKYKDVHFGIHIQGVSEEHLIGDEKRLQQILTNLFENSLRFSTAGGKVDLTVIQGSTSRNRVHMRFILKDTGRTFPKYVLDELTNLYLAQTDSYEEACADTGINLYVTKHLVTALGGTLEVKSTMGEGNTMTVDLPFEKTEQQEMDFEAITHHKILLVADKKTCMERGEMLADMGISYAAANEDEEALDILGEAEAIHEPFDVCMVDMNRKNSFPEILIQEIKELFGEIPIIIATTPDKNAAKENHIRADYFINNAVFRSTIFDALMVLEKGKIYREDRTEDLAKKYDFSGRRILVVEDVALNMEVVVKMLGRVHASVVCAGNGEEALQTYLRQPVGFFDCILMDVNMPVMDGYEATRQIRNSGKADAVVIPIYAMTANAFSEDIAEALRSGMNGHIAKPIDLSILYRTLYKIFHREEDREFSDSLMERARDVEMQDQMRKDQEEHDALTGVYNSYAYEKETYKLLQKKNPIAFLLLDVAGYKEIKETQGPEAGDRILKTVADILKENTRTTDFVARLNEDRFVVLFLNYDKDSQALYDKLERINKLLQQKLGDSMAVSLNMGIDFSEYGYTTDMYQNAEKDLKKNESGKQK